MNTAGNFVPPWREQVLEKIATSVSSAAIRVGRDRGKPLRAWFIGGLGSLVYTFPGNTERYQAQDFLPYWGHEHHRGTERTLKKVNTADVEWSLLCVAWMWPRSKALIDVLERPSGNALLVRKEEMIEWRGSWVSGFPWGGRGLDLLVCFDQYTTRLEDVADLIAEDLASGGREFVGALVGMKDEEKMRAKNA